MVWYGETKGWIVLGVQRWEKRGGQRRGWWQGDWLIALYCGKRLSATTRTRSYCLSAFHHPHLCQSHQLGASQGLWSWLTLVWSCISLPSYQGRPNFSKPFCSGHWHPTCTSIWWIHLYGAYMLLSLTIWATLLQWESDIAAVVLHEWFCGSLYPYIWIASCPRIGCTSLGLESVVPGSSKDQGSEIF